MSSPPVARRRQRNGVSPPGQKTNRESSAVRDSVLGVALEIGLGGGNSTLQNWIYNNQLQEEEEEIEPPRTLPELTKEPSESSHSSSVQTPPVIDPPLPPANLQPLPSPPARSPKSPTLTSPVIFTPSTRVDADSYHNSFFPKPPSDFNATNRGQKLTQGTPIHASSKKKSSSRPTSPNVTPLIPSFSQSPSLKLTMPTGQVAPKLDTPFASEQNKSTFSVHLDDILAAKKEPIPEPPPSPPWPTSPYSASSQIGKTPLTSSSNLQLHKSASSKSLVQEKKKSSRWSNKSSKSKETEYETDGGYLSEGVPKDKRSSAKSAKSLKKSKSTANMSREDDLDDGYVSSKSSKSVKHNSASAPTTPQKSSPFFWRRKSKKDEQDVPPPMPNSAPIHYPPPMNRFGSTQTNGSSDSQIPGTASITASSINETISMTASSHKSPPSPRYDHDHIASDAYANSAASTRSSVNSEERAAQRRFARQSPPVRTVNPLNIQKKNSADVTPVSKSARPNITLPVTRLSDQSLASPESMGPPAFPISGSRSAPATAVSTPEAEHAPQVKGRPAFLNINAAKSGLPMSRSATSLVTSSSPVNGPVSSKSDISTGPSSFVEPTSKSAKRLSAKSITGSAQYREITLFGDVVQKGVKVDDNESVDIDPLGPQSPTSPTSDTSQVIDMDSLAPYDPAAGLDAESMISPRRIDFVNAAAGQYSLEQDKFGLPSPGLSETSSRPLSSNKSTSMRSNTDYLINRRVESIQAEVASQASSERVSMEAPSISSSSIAQEAPPRPSEESTDDRPVIVPQTAYIEDDDDDRSIYPPTAVSATFPKYSAPFLQSPTESVFPGGRLGSDPFAASRPQRDPRTTMYSTYTYEDGADPRISRYSAPDDEDYEVLSAEQSTSARDKLIKRVDAISNKYGAPKFVPPVPKLPREFSQNRF